jgi:hypothetical protein
LERAVQQAAGKLFSEPLLRYSPDCDLCLEILGYSALVHTTGKFSYRGGEKETGRRAVGQWGNVSMS